MELIRILLLVDIILRPCLRQNETFPIMVPLLSDIIRQQGYKKK